MLSEEGVRIPLLLRISLILVLSMLVSGIAVGLITKKVRMDRAVEEGSEAARVCCSTIRNFMIQTNYNPFFLKMGNTEFNIIQEDFLRDLCEGMDLETIEIYFVTPDNKRNHIVFISTDPDIQEYVDEIGRGGEMSDIPLQENEIAALNGQTEGTAMVTDTRFGKVCFYVVPYTASDGRIYLVGASSNMDEVYRKENKDGKYLIIMGGAVFLTAFILIVLMLRFRVIRPIRRLSGRMENFLTERESVFPKRKGKIRDEVTDMEASFREMAKDLNGYVSDIEKLTADKVQADVQLDVARRIQNGMVPPEKGYTGHGCTAYAVMKPALEVGGDFYDIFDLPQGKVGFMIGDVSGKGISAALFMSMTRRILRERLRSGMLPAKALKRSNDEICRENPEGFFATVFAAIWDPAEGRLVYANAGHNPPILFGKTAQSISIQSGDLLGLFEDAEFRNETLDLKEDEGLLLYTDGVTEAVNPERVPYGEERLCRMVTRLGPNPESIVGSVRDDVLSYEGEAGLFDDITLIAFMRREEESIVLSTKIRDLTKLKENIYSFVKDQDLASNIMVVSEEWFVDVASYSGADRVNVDIVREGQLIKVSFRDNGKPFDPTTYQAGEKESEDLEFGGMGIRIIRDLTTEFRYEWVDNENVVTFVFTNTE